MKNDREAKAHQLEDTDQFTSVSRTRPIAGLAGVAVLVVTAVVALIGLGLAAAVAIRGASASDAPALASDVRVVPPPGRTDTTKVTIAPAPITSVPGGDGATIAGEIVAAEPTVRDAAGTPSTTVPRSKKVYGDVILTNADNGRIISVPRAARIEVRLSGVVGIWSEPLSSNAARLRRESVQLLPDGGARAVFRGRAVGRARVTAEATMACATGKPRCLVPNRLFQVTIVLR